MLESIVFLVIVYALYSIITTSIKNRDRMKLLRFLVDNNLLKDMNSVDDLKISRLLNLDSKQPQSYASNKILAIGLCVFGLSLGWITGALLLLALNIKGNYQIVEAIRFGFPMLFAAIGLLYAYNSEEKKRAEAKRQAERREREERQ